MLERLERDVRKTWSDCNLGSVSRLFLSDVLLFEVEGRWCNERFWNRRASVSRPCFHRTSSVRWGEGSLGLRLSASKENRVSSCSTLPEASERYQVLSQSCLSMTSERWENNLERRKFESFPVSWSRLQIKNPRGIIILRAQYFFNGVAYFVFLRGAALLPRPAPKP